MFQVEEVDTDQVALLGGLLSDRGGWFCLCAKVMSLELKLSNVIESLLKKETIESHEVNDMNKNKPTSIHIFSYKADY